MGVLSQTAALIALALSGAIFLWMLIGSMRTRRDLIRFRDGLEQLTHGDPAARLALQGPTRIASLAGAVNRVLGPLHARLESVRRQRDELEAVLASMGEAMIAVDVDERVIKLNAPAAQLMGVHSQWAVNRSLPEVVRNTTLQELVACTLDEDDTVRGEVVLHVPQPRGAGMSRRFLRAHGTAIRDAHGRRIGALIVLHDVTDLRRLEMVRRDFVANVSHEIKTPLTAIKAAVETLQDTRSPLETDTQPFLNMIARQSDRLHSMVEELLQLARIEQDADHRQINLASGRVADVLSAAVEQCQPLAEAKHLRIQTQCQNGLEIRMNDQLLNQAVVNLLNNAIKHSLKRGRIELTAQRNGQGVEISVQDHGRGIDPKHLPRLFERFYRPDSARDRADGGAGLGLAIVKHIAQAHGGAVSVDSTPNRGSTFRIQLPQQPVSLTPPQESKPHQEVTS